MGHGVVVLLTSVNVVVHEVTETSHPGCEGMWRWAVHVGNDWSDRTSCLQAGLEESRQEALQRGQALAVACARVAQRLGASVSGGTSTIPYDPCGEPWPLVESEVY